jgi:hypothetical protein
MGERREYSGVGGLICARGPCSDSKNSIGYGNNPVINLAGYNENKGLELICGARQ